MMRIPIWPAAGLLAGIVSCSTASDAPTRSATRDSAGTQIIENHDAGWNGTPAWTVDPRPALVIGTVDGPEQYQFSGIRGAFRLTDGTFAVADGSRNIRFYDSSGRFTHQYGREGAGPGEFRIISLIRPFDGDSLLVWDQALRRVTIIAADGADGRIVEATTLPGFFFASDVFDDGSLLGHLQRKRGPRQRSTGVARDQRGVSAL